MKSRSTEVKPKLAIERLPSFLHHKPKLATGALHILRSTLQHATPRRLLGLGSARLPSSTGSDRASQLIYTSTPLVSDGVFFEDGHSEVQFHEASCLQPHDWGRLQATVQRRVLRYFRRHGLERLVHYWLRPPFALERLHAPDGQASLSSPDAGLIYRLPGPTPYGRTLLVLSPLELLESLVHFVPLPRMHRHRYHGVLAPNAKWRRWVTRLGGPEPEESRSEHQHPPSRPVGRSTAAIYEDAGRRRRTARSGTPVKSGVYEGSFRCGNGGPDC